MAQRICTIDGCDRPHRARGMCASHYSDQYRQKYGRTTYQRTCVVCSVEWATHRADAQFCSDACKGERYRQLKLKTCRLPADHPVRVEIERLRMEAAQVRRSLAQTERSTKLATWRTPRECRGCGCLFCPLYTPTQLECSKRCARRVARRRRRAREHDAPGDWIWSDFMRVAARFDYCCAYCGMRPTGQLDPDHVVPLSRGGLNSVSNLLPSCRSCNADKRDLLLDEWNEDRTRRGKTNVLTSWAPEDRRFAHLTVLMGRAA